MSKLFEQARDSEARKRAWSIEVAMRIQESELDIDQVFRDASRVREFYAGRTPSAQVMEMKSVRP